MKKSPAILLTIVVFPVILVWLACPGPGDGPKSLGLIETPPMLYKSFRAAGSRAYAGAAPELAADVDLSPYFPKPGDQGMIGSCTAWTTAYACKSFHENREREWGADSGEHLFSPSFIYNQINGGVDQGAPLESAVAIVIENGCATLDTMPYTENIRQQPGQAAFNEAAGYRALSFARVDTRDLAAVKAVLAGGNAVLMGMMLYENFLEYKGGVYNETAGAPIGGHAMCMVGYDDTRGAFKLINSWGTYWGEGGYLWLDYGLFQQETLTCLVMYDEVLSRPKSAAAPVNVTASRGAYADRIRVVWDSAANATAYKIFRSDNPSEYFTETGNTRGTLFIDKNIKPGTVYYYAVKSMGSDKESELSESARGYAGSLETEIGVPQELQGAFTENRVYLKWNEVKGVDGYHVYKFDKETENYLRIGRTQDSTYRDTGRFTDKDVLWYIVAAFKGDRESRASSPVVITVEIQVKKLKPPRNVKASHGSYPDRIDITWKAMAGAEAYNFYKWYVDREEWKLIREVTGTSYTDTETGTAEAYYIITAKNQYAVSGPSEPAWGWVSGFKTGPGEQKYDDEEYYDDSDYFEDTDYTDDSRYKDDKEVRENEKGKDKYTDFTDDEKDKTGEKSEKEKEREKDDKFLNDEKDIITEEAALDKVRNQTSKKDTGGKDNQSSRARDIVADEMSKSDEEFFADDDDEFFADETDDDFFSDEPGADDTDSFFNDNDDDFFSDDDDDFF